MSARPLVWLIAIVACKSDPPAPSAAPAPAAPAALPTPDARPSRVVAFDAAPLRSPQPAVPADADPTAQGRVTEDPDRRSRVEELRSRLDADHDGKLTVDELRRSAYTRLDPATVDTNRDGVISLDELEAALAPRRR